MQAHLLKSALGHARLDWDCRGYSVRCAMCYELQEEEEVVEEEEVEVEEEE